MADICSIIKTNIEGVFSMPFDINVISKEGENHFKVSPYNDDDALFVVEAYIHNNIRIKCEISPQRHAARMVQQMGIADEDKKQLFFSYMEMLRTKGARVKFFVNSAELNKETWPDDWRNISCLINKIPLSEDNDWVESSDVLTEWITHSINLMFSLLTISEVKPYSMSKVEEPAFESFVEGNKFQVTLNRYERNPINRELCLQRKGYSCAICGFNFKDTYGQIGKHFIEVHHITPVSVLGPDYRINIDKDLIPVCSNCHSMLHKRNPPYNPEELVSILASAKKNIILAITYPSQIEASISTGKIALGLRKELLSSFTITELEFIILHNWQNENAYMYKIIDTPTLSDVQNIPDGYLIKYKNNAELFLLIKIDKKNNLFKVSDYNITHLQPKDRSLRYNLQFIAKTRLLSHNINSRPR